MSDPDGTLCEQYGVLKEKKMFGKTFKGLVRSTFIIDAKGRIAAEWRNVKVRGHVQDVIAALGGI